MSENKFGKLDVNKVDLGKLDMKNFTLPTNSLSYSIESVNRALKESEKNMIEASKEREQYKQDVLNTLKKIEGNTANLTTIVNLIQTSEDNQGEVLEIITRLLALAKEKDSEVVNSKYRELMNKITTFTEDVNTISTLVSFGTMILTILKSGV